jgi:predicted P-loop ATPase
VLAGGRQGIGKSTWCRQILPKELEDYFVEGKIEENKDFKFRMCRNIIMYDDEFGGVGTKDVKNFKSVSDMSVAVDRKAYGINDSRELRKVSLLGSTNELDILKDPTGNRRILPIKVESIDYDACVNFDSKALIAEAYKLYLDGFEWVIRKEDELNFMKSENDEFYENDEMEDLFFARYSIQQTKDFFEKVVLNKGEILKIFSNTNIKFSKYDLRKIYVRNEMKYDSFKLQNGEKKKGFVLFEKNEIINKEGDTPF